MAGKDWIGIMEAAYDLDGSLEDWLAGVARASAPVLDRGAGAAAQAFRLGSGGVRFDGIAVSSEGLGADDILSSIEGAPPHALERVYRAPFPASSLSEALFGELPEERDRFSEKTRRQFVDVVGIVAHSGDGIGVAVNAPTLVPVRMPDREKARWRRIAPHIANGYRLRRALQGRPPTTDDRDVEAVLDPSGSLLDARSAGASKTAREILRAAVGRRERARGRIRHTDPHEAMTLWQGLVRGRWSLVDLYDSQGRRFVVARRNDRGEVDPRGLSDGELVASEQLGFGYAPKEISYSLGLAYSTVMGALASARRKLGVGSLAELAALFAPSGPRQRLREIQIAGERLAFASLPLGDPELLARLTDTERAVALNLLQGGTLHDIATRRQISQSTLANQAQSIYRKLDVTSRTELAAKLVGGSAAR